MTGTTGCPVLILGATGLLGQALKAEANRRRRHALGVARHAEGGLSLDLTDEAALRALLDQAQPALVVNAAANTSLDDCERRPAEAYLVNTRLPGVLARLCSQRGVRLVHVSTDHYYCGRSNQLHDEHHPVVLVNEYARGKYAAEALVATCPDALILRTNIVGFRGWTDRPTFAEWALDALQTGNPFNGYSDMWTSSIDVDRFAAALFDLVDLGATGVLNVAAREATSKLEFIQALAVALGLDASIVRPTRLVSHCGTARANALGLDVSRAEALLGRRLPSAAEVTAALAHVHQELTHEA